MKLNENLSSSQEDYLEAIYQIIKEKQAARAKDITQRLNIKGASVTGALRSLSQKGLINYAPYDIITLTPEGKALAEDVVHRHNTIKTFLNEVLQIDIAEAEENACRMEHSISPNVLERLIKFMGFVKICPKVEDHWVEAFKDFNKTGDVPDICKRCVAALPEKEVF